MIKSTDKTINLPVEISRKISMAKMTRLVTKVAEELGLYVSKTTKLGTKRYPGNTHWHFKQDPKRSGCLDATYWPEGRVFWVSIRKYEPRWVHREGRAMARLIAERV